MAYAHCHNCDWQQDDWWSANYSPLDYERLKEFNELLLEAVKNPNARMMGTMDHVFLKERFGTNHEVDVREYVAHHLICMARRIKEMHWLTEEEFRNNRQCPKCKSKKHMDVD